MKRKLTLKDYQAMTWQRLLAYWIILSADDEGKINNPDQAEKIIAGFEAQGREVVEATLAQCGYTTEDKPVISVSLAEAKDILLKLKKTNDYRLFSVNYVKREDQSLRQMTCRYGVDKSKHVGKKFEDKDYNLTTVWDINVAPRYSTQEQQDVLDGKIEPKKRGGYRSISLEGLISMKIVGQEFVVLENKDILESLKS